MPTPTHGKDPLDILLESLEGTETTLWGAHPPLYPFPDYAQRINYAERIKKKWPPIIAVANYKGGVGKTTVTINLAAYFQEKLGQVLLIDLDYQGSMTTMLRSYYDSAERESEVPNPLSAEADIGVLLAAKQLKKPFSRAALVPAFYELALHEDRVMVRWLVGRSDNDVRYRLARILLDERIQKTYKVILIDTPPRLTTGTINALCAATHVLVPTIFNTLSAEPVANFLRMTKRLLSKLNPEQEVIGVLETLSPPKTQGQREREAARTTIVEMLKKSFPNVGIINTVVQRRVGIAEEGVAYFDSGMRPDFEGLGNELKQRLKL